MDGPSLSLASNFEMAVCGKPPRRAMAAWDHPFALAASNRRA